MIVTVTVLVRGAGGHVQGAYCTTVKARVFTVIRRCWTAVRRPYVKGYSSTAVRTAEVTLPIGTGELFFIFSKQTRGELRKGIRSVVLQSTVPTSGWELQLQSLETQFLFLCCSLS